MTINGNCRSLLIGGVAVMAGLALAGCNRDSSTSAAKAPVAPVATASTAPAVGSTPPPADAAAQPADETGNEVADMEHHHKQAMDHADMRADAAKPDAPPPADSPPAPMKHM